MHKKQVKKQSKNKVGIHKNTPLSIQIPYEKCEEFINKHLEIKPYDSILELLSQDSKEFECSCRVSEEMLLDCLLDEEEGYGEESLEEEKHEEGKLGESNRKEDGLEDIVNEESNQKGIQGEFINQEGIQIESNSEVTSISKDYGPSLYDLVSEIGFDDEESNLIHSHRFNSILELYKRQREINRNNRNILKNAIREPLQYFGNVDLLRDIDQGVENVFKKRKYKKIKKSSKIFDRGVKPVDNSAAEDIVSRREEFKRVSNSLDFPILKDVLVEDNVDIGSFINEEDRFREY